MKFFHTHLNTADNIDGWISHIWRRHADMVDTIEECDVILFSFVWQKNYAFDSDLAIKLVESGKPVVVLDFHEHSEVGKTSILGFHFSEKLTPNYRRLHDFFVKHPPVIYFKRELPVDSDIWNFVHPFPVRPVDYMHDFAPAEVVDAGAYFERPLDILMLYGYSHISRYLLHGALLTACRHQGWTVLNAYEDFEWWMHNRKKGARCIGLMPVPHYRRIPIEMINLMQSQSRITVSCYGAGIKCWRSAEAGYNSLAAHQDPDLVRWAYRWVDGVNCIVLPNEPRSETMAAEDASDRLVRALTVEKDLLYARYRRCVEHTEIYRAENYFRDYLMPAIRRAINWRAAQSASTASLQELHAEPAAMPSQLRLPPGPNDLLPEPPLCPETG